jgi:lysophospholipase L1-like esterase
MRSGLSGGPGGPGDPRESSTRVAAPFARAFAGAILGLAAADGFAGWLARADDRSGSEVNVPDEFLGWTNRPLARTEFSHLDEHGLRSEPIPADAPRDERRILGTGASQVFGAGGVAQEDTWSYQLEALLAESAALGAGARCRVLNGGVMGYSMSQSCRRAELLLDELALDVVLVFCAPSRQQLLDGSSKQRWVEVGGRAVPEDVVAGWPSALHPLLAGGHELALHSSLYARRRALALRGSEVGQELAHFVLTRAAQPAVVESFLGAALADAASLVEACRERGIELRFVVYPEFFADTEAHWNGYLKRNAAAGAPPLGTPRREPVEALAERLAEVGGRCWEFLDEISRMGGDRGRYMQPDNDHWSPAGHGLVAEGIRLRLEREGLLAAAVERRRAQPH